MTLVLQCLNSTGIATACPGIRRPVSIIATAADVLFLVIIIAAGHVVKSLTDHVRASKEGINILAKINLIIAAQENAITIVEDNIISSFFALQKLCHIHLQQRISLTIAHYKNILLVGILRQRYPKRPKEYGF